DNVKQATKTEFDAHNNDTVRHVTQADKDKWNAMLPAANYTSADVLNKIKTVDGSGSGLDADTLDGKDSSAFAQRAFSNVKVGSTTVAADSPTDTLELVAGSNVTLTPDATNDKVTISANVPVSSVNGKTGAVSLSAADVGAVSTDDYVNHPAFAVASGTANTYSVTLNPAPTGYTDGMAISIKINVDSTGPSTLNVNGLGAVPLKKSNGNDVTNLKANGVYTFRYNASTGNFILQGEGGSGNAQPSDVLSGKTFTNDSGEQTGTMPNNGAITITPTTTDQAIPQGYHNGSGKVKGSPNLIAPNIKKGVNIFDVIGSFVEVQPGDAIVFSAINNASTSSKSMVKVKEIIVSVGRVYRVSFDLNSTNGYTAYAQIYVNGTPRGTLRQTNSSSDVKFTEDIELQDNDALQIYARISGSSYSANVANVNDLKIGVDVGSFQNTMT
ncbi:MAG: hypothetical protein LKH86_24710, partial [Heyndrickxia oleronia]|nr:hypothetical protein [Heyndrickxia oleronia]